MTMRIFLTGLMGLLTTGALLAGCNQPTTPTPPSPAATAAAPAETPAQPEEASAGDPAPLEGGVEPTGTLNPLPGMEETAPKVTRAHKVKFTTDAGEFVVEVYPEAAPHAASRFVELVKAGFYDNTPISRVVRQPEPFVAQFGVNWREGMKEWKEKTFTDDPSYYKLEKGTLAFAKAGPDTNSTQVFINFRDNSPLASQQMGGFTTFGQVVEGMDVIEKFKSVGDPSMGLDQGRLWNDGEAYLKGLEDKPTMIQKAEVVE